MELEYCECGCKCYNLNVGNTSYSVFWDFKKWIVRDTGNVFTCESREELEIWYLNKIEERKKELLQELKSLEDL